MREAEEIVALAKAKRLTLMVGHMKRFDRRFETIKRKIDEGAVGRVFLAKSEWTGPREIFDVIPWAAKAGHGGGPLMGFGSHHLDLLQWMLGPVKRVGCYTNRLARPDAEVEDSAVAILEFDSGAIGSLIYTWAADIHGQYEGMTIHGTEGTLALEDEEVRFTSPKVYGDRTPRVLDVAREDSQDIEAFGKELAIASLEPFVRELTHFVDCAGSGRRPMTDGPEAAKAVEIIARAYRAAETR
jgi:predicted dehydrogenase